MCIKKLYIINRNASICSIKIFIVFKFSPNLLVINNGHSFYIVIFENIPYTEN